MISRYNPCHQASSPAINLIASLRIVATVLAEIALYGAVSVRDTGFPGGRHAACNRCNPAALVQGSYWPLLKAGEIQ